MKLFTPTLLSLSVLLLTACGGGSGDKAQKAKPKPAFTMSAGSSALDVAESNTVTIPVTFSNASGAVTLSAVTTNIANVGSVTVTAGGSNIDVTFNELDMNISHNLVINGTDSSGSTASTSITVNVENTSALPKINRYESIQESIDSLINVEDERSVMNAMLELSRMTATYSDEEYQTARFNFAQARVVSKVQHNDALMALVATETPSSEIALDELIAQFDTAYSTFITPVNEQLIINQASLNALFPALNLNQLHVDQNGITSQFFGNPSMGEGTPFTFNPEYQFLHALILPASQSCNLEL
ncbi:MAG: hypothetical protein HAW66_10970 [Shewanella sp.]|nr:hypothetical protein [Shewanella sp.]